MAELISTMAQLPITNGCTVVWEAIDPTTGAAVTGVVITNAVLYGYDLSGSGLSDLGGPNPLLTPTDIEGQDVKVTSPV